MLQVEMTDDIRKYDTKFMGPFTKRQFISISVALVFAIPIAILIPGEIDMKLMVACLTGAPIALCGFVKLDGAYLEVLALRWVYQKILTPPRRKYISPCEQREFLKKLERKEEINMLNKMTKKQRKAYELKKNRSVKYYNNKEYKVYS